jgi:hypothetical protein
MHRLKALLLLLAFGMFVVFTSSVHAQIFSVLYDFGSAGKAVTVTCTALRRIPPPVTATVRFS